MKGIPVTGYLLFIFGRKDDAVMDMDYKPNSNLYKSERKKVEAEGERRAKKVIKGSARVRKKSEIRKFADVFISEDISNVKQYIFMDVIVPLVQETICDIFEDVPRMIFYGSRGSGRKSTVDRVSYRDYSKKDNYRRNDSFRDRENPDYGDIVLGSKGEAEKVLYAMDEIMDEYGMVRVGDLYDLAGESCPYTLDNYGWLNIRNAKIVRVRDGYVIEMPKAVPIK